MCTCMQYIISLIYICIFVYLYVHIYLYYMPCDKATLNLRCNEICAKDVQMRTSVCVCVCVMPTGKQSQLRHMEAASGFLAIRI